ncbi:MAG: hypothetical protein AABZ55_07340, partial [Bdellovibrionota bacterium]
PMHSEAIALDPNAGFVEPNQFSDIPNTSPVLDSGGTSSLASTVFIDNDPTLVPAMPQPNPSGALSHVRNYSENAAVVKASAQIALPFSLRINGELETYEREKLLDVLSAHGTGISAVDLEPQFTGNKILIPRISEYTLVCIVQTLRGTAAQMRFGLSDSIYASDDTKEESPKISEYALGAGAKYADEEKHLGAAVLIPVTSSGALPEISNPFVVDTVTASAALKSESVEANTSSEYQEILENLQKELKYKAFRKGAVGIVNFAVQLTQLTMPTHYRLTVLGTAIRPRIATDPATLPKGRYPSA